MNTEMNNSIVESADVIAFQLLEDMVKIKTDIEKFEFILNSLKIKYKNTQNEYSKIYGSTTAAKEFELERKDKQRLAQELDKALFLERQQERQQNQIKQTIYQKDDCDLIIESIDL